ncbi:hypothetical protein VC83_01675 [Pseudogymnoascus destructans]|uniref:Uncharacterized protein n=1 Tax=Pseudogymnoascus destructans TaxID=655981 RepID=A0A177AJ54_9PEZI|nr:uncharacterized protein VC83_01675 [Pseudogymnoascus destructans]OAF62096.1 hypothetical protein VC83_01675 [Pseudogymnoascus destructans]
MAPSKSTHKTAPQPVIPNDPPQSQCTAIQLVKDAERDLTYNEMYYRQQKINLRHQEIVLAKAEHQFQEQPCANPPHSDYMLCEPTLTQDEINYRNEMIDLHNRELDLEKGERALRDQP